MDATYRFGQSESANPAASMIMRRPRPIGWLVLCGVFLIAAIAFGTAMMVLNFRDRALANSERELQNTALLLSRYVDQELEELELVQKGIIERMQSAGIASGHDYARQMSDHEIHLMLKDRIAGLPHVAGMSLYDSNGKLINLSRSWPVPVVQVDDREYFKALKSGSQLTTSVSQPVRNRANGAWTIVLARRFDAPNGEFMGVVVGGINLEHFEDFFSSLSLGAQSSIALSRSDGLLLVRYPRIESAVGQFFPGAITALDERDFGTIRLVGKMVGKDRMLAAHRLQNFPLIVTIGIDIAAVLADWLEQTKLLIAVASLSVLVIAVILFLIVRQLLRAHKWSEQRLTSEKQRLHTAVNNMTQGLLLFDSSARIIVCNQRYVAMYGLSADVVKPGCTFRDLIAHRKETGTFAGDIDDYCSSILRDLAQGKASQVVTETADGRSIQIVNQPLTDGGWVATHEDITERRRSDERIAHLAHYDALTDLPNRVLFREQLEQALKWVHRGEYLAVLYLDLDHFKGINDTLGHPAGDELLKAVAARLRGCLRDTETAVRLGGDEFAIIQTALSQPTDATELVKRIQDSIREPFEIGGHQLVTDTSIGIALAPDDGTEPDQLLKNADLALYGAKAEGRGTYRFFEPDMDARVKARRALEFDLRQAIMSDGFELYYQPLVNLRDNRVCGCEALLRWRHPERGEISPAEFIPAAEETGLINQLGEWALRTACAEAATWPDDIKVAINVSPVQFKSKTLALTVIGALAASNLPARRLELEITEAVLISDDEGVLATLHQLREIGVRVAMDDFGTGYSSLSYLQRFPFDKIKIDRCFIRDVAEKDGSAPIVQAVIGIARSRNIATTAEGVETGQQRDQLRTLGCTEMQGYLISPPIAATAIVQLFRSLGEKAAAVA